MDNLTQTRNTDDWRPVVWLIGIMLLVHGVNSIIIA